MASKRDIKRSNLWIDADQGQQEDGRAFGFIGVSGTDDDYCGMFFSWPRDTVGITSVAEREAVVDSLEYDETTQHETEIPHSWCQQKLRAYLMANYDLRKRS